MRSTTSETADVTRQRIPAVRTAAAVLIALTACGGDDDDDDTAATSAVTAEANLPTQTEPAAPEPAATEPAGTEPADIEPVGTIDIEFAEYCALSLELEQQQSLPTADQLTTILAVVPEEIAAEAETFVDAFVAAGDDVDPSIFAEFGEELAVIEAFDAQHCGITGEVEEPPDPAVVSIDPAGHASTSTPPTSTSSSSRRRQRAATRS